MVVQKIIELSSVDLIHGYSNCKVSLMIFPVVNTSLKKIFDRNALQAVHGVSLSRSCLAIREYGYNSLVENQVKNGPDLIKVQLLSLFFVIEAIVELEVLIDDGLGDSIDLVPAVMHYDLWIHHRNHINLSVSELSLEDRPLFEADTDVHLVSKGVHFALFELFSFVFYHNLEIHVHLDAMEIVVSLSLTLELAHLLHF